MGPETILIWLREKKPILIRFSVVGAVVLVLMMLFFYYFRFQLEQLIRSETDIYVKEAAERNAVALREKVNGDMDMLEGMALVLGGQQEFDKDQWLKALSGSDLLGEFQRFGFIMPDGKAYSLEIYGMDLSDREYVREALQGKPYISDVIIDKAENKPYLSYVVPVKKDGNVIALVGVGIYTEKYNAMLDLSIFSNKTTSMVINGNGDIVIRGSYDETHRKLYAEENNLFDSIEFNGVNAEQMKQAMQDGTTGSLILNEGSEKEDNLIYSPVGIRDWYLVTIIPDYIIVDRFAKIEKEAFFMAGMLMVLVIGFISVIAFRQRRYNHQIENRNRELRKLFAAVRQSPVGIVITDLSGRIEYANEAACRITGFSYEELLGQNPNVLKSGTTTALEYDELWNTITGGREWRGIFCNKRKDGTLYWESAIIAPVFNKENKITNFLAIKEDITERKAAQNDLNKYKAVSDQLSYGVAITDLDGNIEYVNNAFANMHRWPVGELIGKNVSVLQTDENLKNIGERIERIKTEGGLRAHEMERKAKDGTVFPALMTSGLVFDSMGEPQYISITVINNTEAKEKEAELNKFYIAMKQSTIAFVITDLQANILYANPAFEQITGYGIEEIIGKNARIMGAGQTSQEIYRELWTTIQSGKTWKGQWVNRKKNGEPYTEKISITPIYDNHQKIINYLAVKEDVTELLKAEENRIAREVAEKTSQSKTTFLSNMSHEIRTPLNAIIGFSQILKRDESMSDKQAHQIDTILRSSEHLLKLINSILDLAKIESGRIAVTNHDFSLYDLLEDLRMMFGFQAQNKSLSFDIDLGDEVPKYLCSDDEKIRQMLINLIGNAMKFTNRGGVTLKVSAIPTEEENRMLIEFNVVDTGPGIVPEELGHIFESFSQTETGIKAGGTGLGLSICKSFAELMGGRITVESQLDIGSVFQVILPVSGVMENPRPPVKTYEKLIGLAEDSGPFRILIADDVEYNRQMLVDVLDPVGFELREAATGQEALDIFDSWKPHCILMDIKMPNVDGYDAIKRIKETKQGMETLVIAVTASAFDKDIDRIMATGADLFLSKPFRLEELYRMLESIEGLKYKYAEAEASDLSEMEPTAEEIRKGISSEMLLKMHTAVKGGDIAVLREHIREIKKLDPSIAEYLNSLAKAYDYEKLIGILGREEESSNE